MTNWKWDATQVLLGSDSENMSISCENVISTVI